MGEVYQDEPERNKIVWEDYNDICFFQMLHFMII
jgi:hypothetical protein